MDGYGDRLARGATSAIFGPQDNKITDEKWKKAFEGFDPEEFKKKTGKEKDDEKSGDKEKTRV